MLDWLNWKDLVPHALWAAIGGGTGYLWARLRAWHKTRGHRAIFAGLEAPPLFVFPPRQATGGSLLPRMAVEDFLAINNIISAYLRAGLSPPDKIRDSSFLTPQDRKQHSLILLCSSRSNSVTKEALELLRARNERMRDLIPYFAPVPGASDQIQLTWNQAFYPSASYEQQRQQGSPLDDIAVIIKAENPWAAQHKVLIVAGIRGIGTWGAAEFLKKWWEDVFVRKDHSRRRGTSKQGDFVAILAVRYQDQDIKTVKLLQLADLEPAYSRQDHTGTT